MIIPGRPGSATMPQPGPRSVDLLDIIGACCPNGLHNGVLFFGNPSMPGQILIIIIR